MAKNTFFSCIKHACHVAEFSALNFCDDAQNIQCVWYMSSGVECAVVDSIKQNENLKAKTIFSQRQRKQFWIDKTRNEKTAEN